MKPEVCIKLHIWLNIETEFWLLIRFHCYFKSDITVSFRCKSDKHFHVVFKVITCLITHTSNPQKQLCYYKARPKSISYLVTGSMEVNGSAPPLLLSSPLPQQLLSSFFTPRDSLQLAETLVWIKVLGETPHVPKFPQKPSFLQSERPHSRWNTTDVKPCRYRADTTGRTCQNKIHRVKTLARLLAIDN